MWTNLKHVANHQFLDPDKFVPFALAHASQFDVENEMVNTWNVDALLKAYKSSIPADVLESDRQAAIKLDRELWAKYTHPVTSSRILP
jgi:hypothetical protein